MNLADYARLVLGTRCILCEEAFQEPITIGHYQHTQGWLVENFSELQWLYITCYYCDYQNALWKLGVKGSVHDLLRSSAQAHDLLH